jgi:protoporphyrinogen/coproporphyrinogen III oxidase
VSRRVVVVGGGVAGLTTAYRLAQVDGDAIDVTVLEADATPGGKVRSATVGGIELEAGPDSLLARKPAAVELAKELGMGGDLVPAATGKTSIWSEGRLLRFPTGPFGISTDIAEMLRWPGMSYAGKVRAGADLVLPARKEQGDESLGSLLRRRLGDEATEKLVAPLLGGLFAGDIDRLSVQATFPELATWEREGGGLIRGARAASKARSSGGKRPPMFIRLKGGLRRLTGAMADALGPRVRCGVAVQEVRREGEGYVLRADGEAIEADAVVFASPAFATADLVEVLAPDAARLLRQIPYVSTAVVLMVYPAGTGPALPDSSGFVVPRGRLPMTACTLLSRKWPDESFGDRAVVRCFVGAAGEQGALDLSDEELVGAVSRSLPGVLPLPAEPEAAEVVRWPNAMPQYEVDHLDNIAAIEQALPPGAFVVGQAYRGAGIPDCVRAAGEVAGRVRAHPTGKVEGRR